MTKARLVLAIISTAAVETALVGIWRWGLPELEIRMPLAVLIIVMAAYAVFAVADFLFITRIIKRQALVGLPTMVGTEGKAASPLAPEGMVRIRGELWGAEVEGDDIKKGEKVKVIRQEGLKLTVSRKSPDKLKH
ncbi:NfeD family protein [Chloroflexota bacterium]